MVDYTDYLIAMKYTILVLIITIVSLWDCGSAGEKPPARLPLGVVDAPKAGETVRGNTRIAGWALDESGIRDVSIYVDRTFIGTATLGLTRPDLVKLFPNLPESGYGGFEYQWD